MPSSKWITAEQYVILSKYSKKWANKLVRNDMNYIASYRWCVVGSVHETGNYNNCSYCDNYSEILNTDYNEVRMFDNGTDDYFHALHKFRTALGNFLNHCETAHKDLIKNE